MEIVSNVFVSSQIIAEDRGRLGHNAMYSTVLKLETTGFSETSLVPILPNCMASHPTGP
jgi:hypothetical protein